MWLIIMEVCVVLWVLLILITVSLIQQKRLLALLFQELKTKLYRMPQTWLNSTNQNIHHLEWVCTPRVMLMFQQHAKVELNAKFTLLFTVVLKLWKIFRPNMHQNWESMKLLKLITLLFCIHRLKKAWSIPQILMDAGIGGVILAHYWTQLLMSPKKANRWMLFGKWSKIWPVEAKLKKSMLSFEKFLYFDLLK